MVSGTGDASPAGGGHDAVVIGAGPNGLVAANLLADRGWRVVVLEAQPDPGGAVRSAELIEPGFIHDRFSAFYPLAAASPIINGLGLDDHGLVWKRAPLALAHPAADGSCPVLSMDLDETAAVLDRHGEGDGEQWRALYDLWERLGHDLLDVLFTPFPPILAGARVGTRLRPSELVDFVRFTLLPARTMAEEEFTSAAARRLVAGCALHADLAPEGALGGFLGWMLLCLGQELGWPVPEGGAGNLTAALVRRLEDRGGEVRCVTRVEHIVVRRGRAVAVRTADGTEVDAGRAVLADVSAPALYLRLLDEADVPARVRDGIKRFHWDAGTVKVDWTLDGPIPWAADDARRAGTVHVVDSVDDLTMAAAQTAAGGLPDTPLLILGQQSMTDPTRSPPGKETAWAYVHVPAAAMAADPSSAERVVAAMEARIEALAPGFCDLIRGRHVLTPAGLEAADENLVGGAINGGTAQIHQQLVFRPIPGLGRPTTPIAGLYLASASAHPGGGVHGACGAIAARVAVQHDRLRRATALFGR